MTRFCLVFVLLVAGCNKPISTTTPPQSSPSPEAGTSIVVKPLVFDSQGIASMSFDANEAVLVSVNTGEAPSKFYYAFADEETAPITAFRTQATSEGPAAASVALEKLSLRRGKGYHTLAFAPTLGDTLPILTSYRYPEQTKIQTQCAYLGDHSYVLVDTRDIDSPVAQAASVLGKIFDQQIYPSTTELLGQDPAGRSDDSFNQGQDRLFIVITQDLKSYSKGILGLMSPVDLLNGNFAKVLYLNPDATIEALLPVMAHEFAHLIFTSNRLVAYSKAIGNNQPLSYDAAYINQGAYRQEKWLNEGTATLAMLANGYIPEMGCGVVSGYLRSYLERPEDFDLTVFDRQSQTYPGGGPSEDYGGCGLFMAYAHGIEPKFLQRLETATATGTEAVTEAIKPLEFSALYRDFGVALYLDGLSPAVPAKYQIPFVNLRQTCAFPYTFKGPNTVSSPTGTRAPRRYGVRYAKVQIPNGKGKLQLGVTQPSAYQGTLILLQPSKEDSFSEE